MIQTKFLIVLLLAACAAAPQPRPRPGDVSVRLSAGGGLSRAKVEKDVPFLGQVVHVEEDGDGPAALGRLEVSAATDGGPDLGAYADLGHGAYGGEIGDADHLALGGILRQYIELGRGSGLRPFAEVRAGFRQTWVGEVSGGGLDLGAGFGVEWSTGRRTSMHVTVGYDRGTTDAGDTDTSFDGVTLMIGGTVRL